MFTPYARKEVLAISIGGAFLTALLAWLAGWWGMIPAILALAVLSFYRDPPRNIPPGNNLILSAADGRVVEVSRNAAGPDGQPCVRIMTFLSVLNVHVNRSPCAGHVKQVEYKNGEFLSALRADADTRNEANTLLIAPEPPLTGPIRVRQIAGVLARRIVCTASPGTELAAGERFGMIKLGSRTEVCLPERPDWELHVRVGDTVRGGVTILASLPLPASGNNAPVP